MKPPLEAKPIGSMLRVVLHRQIRLANAATIDVLRELDRALDSHDFGRVNQVLEAINRRAKTEARAAGKGGRKP
ncbi:MAG: hypothetical protein ACLP9L_22235 [Thermoguttaceae bacterium]